MKAYRILFGLALAAGVSAAPSTSLAQCGEGASGESGGSLVESRKAEVAAMNAMRMAERDREKARQKVIATFKTTQPEYVKAEADLTKAKAAMEQAKLAAQAKTRSTPEYRAAAAGKATVQGKLNAIREERGLAADKERDALLSQNMKYVTTVNRLENASLANDANYADAKTRVAELTKVLDGFKSQIDDAARQDPEYMAADAVVVTATETYNAAKAATAEAQKAIAAAAKEARAAKAAERGSSRGGKSE